MAAVPLFWYINIATVKSIENDLLAFYSTIATIGSTSSPLLAVFALRSTLNCLYYTISTNYAKVTATKRLPRLSTKILEEIYFKTVIPEVTYCISVWGGCTAPIFNKLEEVHVKAARFIYSMSSDQDNSSVLRIANWHPHSYTKSRFLNMSTKPSIKQLQCWFKNCSQRERRNLDDQNN